MEHEEQLIMYFRQSLRKARLLLMRMLLEELGRLLDKAWLFSFEEKDKT
jgi:hypothetical protein